jgi:hypothetical protein
VPVSQPDRFFVVHLQKTAGTTLYLALQRASTWWASRERFGDFWAELEDRFGWDLGEQLRANTTEPEPGEVSEWLERRIRIDNEIDFRLYRYAVDLVDRRAGRH